MIQKGTVKDLASLEREIYRHRKAARKLEARLDENLEFLQANYRSMAFRAILPAKIVSKGTAGSLLQLALQNEKLRETLTVVAGHFFGKAAETIQTFCEKLFSEDE